MTELFPHAMPMEGFIGGSVIGIAAALMLVGLGRIAGVGGMTARVIGLSRSGMPRVIAAAFIIGLPLGALLVRLLIGGVEAQFPSSIWPLVIGGIIVGYGARMGSGCISGHGICGVSRLSRRSIFATATFMITGFITVALMRAAGFL